MVDTIITGASRGIGRALALALAGSGSRLVLVARDRERLKGVERELADRGATALVVAGDLGSLASARALGQRLVDAVDFGATLVHNAGLWPTSRVLGEEGLEASFVVNHLGPLEMQASLALAKKLARVMVVSAGIIATASFDARRTPSGEDFSRFKTYGRTKLAFAIATKDFAAAHPEIDVVALHPGVVATDLGATVGVVGALLRFAKRFWETPETCATRLARTLGEPRWSPAGEARWRVKEERARWPRPTEDPAIVDAVRDATRRHLA